MVRWFHRVALCSCILFCLYLLCACASPQKKTVQSTPIPTTELTSAATEAPAAQPTEVPTDTPTEVPTEPITEGPTSQPTKEPTPEPTFEPVTLQMLDDGYCDSFFDDTVFIGDSITWTLARFVTKIRKEQPEFLGSSKFLGAIGMSAQFASWNEPNRHGINFIVQGKDVSVTEGIHKLGAKKAFILLGLNDIGCREWNDVEGYFSDLLDAIHRECPDTEVILQGVLPVTESYCTSMRYDIMHWNSFNEILERIAMEHDADYISFADQLMNENGYLRRDLSSDGQYHLNEDGERIWIRNLRAYAAKQMFPGAAVELP